jgi:hypothetical protein
MKSAIAALLALASSIAFAMGPDPGGHTGATVTPETTKTDRPTVDSARQSASGSKTETNGAATDKADKAQQARKK